MSAKLNILNICLFNNKNLLLICYISSRTFINIDGIYLSILFDIATDSCPWDRDSSELHPNSPTRISEPVYRVMIQWFYNLSLQVNLFFYQIY